jgi:DNA-binding transcriptional regulator YiaG
MIDVRGVRRRLGLSQSEFASKFGFPTATLRNWEQGRTRPDGPARVLLAIIARALMRFKMILARRADLFPLGLVS